MTGPDVTRSKELLAKSMAAGKEGRKLIDIAVALRSEAFDTLPAGVRLGMHWPRKGEPPLIWEMTKPGKWATVGFNADPGSAPEHEWMREQWENGNLWICEDQP